MKKKLIKKSDGGPGDLTLENAMKAKRSGLDQASLADNISYALASGRTPANASSIPNSQQLLQSAFIWRAQGQGKTPEQLISSFYSRPIDENNPIDVLRRSIGKLDNDPVAAYYNSPNQQLQALQKHKNGGQMKLTKADLGIQMPNITQIGQGPQPIQAPQLYRTPGFTPSTNMQGTQQNNPNVPNQQGDINWDHVMASYVAQNLASGMVSRFSPNSQQNTIQKFNQQQFNPMSFLPYTQNNSVQDQFGTPQMKKGGTIMADGGYFGGSDDEMRKWILGEEDSSSIETPEAPQQPQQEAPQYNDEALQFANFVQMMGLDQVDGEKGPEDQDQENMYGHGGPVTDGELYEILGDEASDDHLDRLAKGGWIQKASASIKRRGTKGVCTGSKFGGPSCRPGTRRYALAKTFKHMAHKRKKHEDGGPVGQGEIDLSPETIIGLIGQGYQFDV